MAKRKSIRKYTRSGKLRKRKLTGRLTNKMRIRPLNISNPALYRGIPGKGVRRRRRTSRFFS